jgi:hypothetical protein
VSDKEVTRHSRDVDDEEEEEDKEMMKTRKKRKTEKVCRKCLGNVYCINLKFTFNSFLQRSVGFDKSLYHSKVQEGETLYPIKWKEEIPLLT